MDMDRIVKDLKQRPQTYTTLLGQIWHNCTQQTKIRRKLTKLCNEGVLYRTLLSFNKLLFYHPEKTYTLFFEQHELKVVTYYAYEYTEDPLYVHVRAPYKLCETSWEQIGDIVLDKEKLLKVV